MRVGKRGSSEESPIELRYGGWSRVPKTWLEALASYSYRVDLRDCQRAREFPGSFARYSRTVWNTISDFTHSLEILNPRCRNCRVHFAAPGAGTQRLEAGDKSVNSFLAAAQSALRSGTVSRREFN